MKTTITIFLLLVIFTVTAQDKPVAIVGATIIDISNYGDSDHDVADAIVILQHGKIIAAGEESRIKIPPGTAIIHAEGRYIVPGLIDCFSVIGTQGQANSQLYYGVTTIVAGPGNYQRKGFFPQASPAPHIKMRVNIPSRPLEQIVEKKGFLSPDDINKISLEIDKIDSLKETGVTTILLQHMFPEELIPKMVAQCDKYGINTIGEIQYAHYNAGLKSGINSFVHTSRYILGAFPDSVFLSSRDQHDSLANVIFSRYFYGFNIDSDPTFNNYAKAIASSHTALMPTLAMLYSSLSDHQNIWKETGAYLTDPKDVYLPMDTATGKSTSWISTKSANRQVEFEKAFIKAGAHYITGSGADAFGTLPGISEHIEIQMLHRYGLTNREALAAATNNPSIVNHWLNIGLIEAGRNADLLLLSANPVADLENLKKINMLWLNGILIDRTSLLNVNQ